MSNFNFEEAINNLSNDDVKVRKEAIESLVGTTDEKAIEPLIKATTDDNAQVRFKAAEILGNMGDVAVDKLIEEFIHTPRNRCNLISTPHNENMIDTLINKSLRGVKPFANQGIDGKTFKDGGFKDSIIAETKNNLGLCIGTLPIVSRVLALTTT